MADRIIVDFQALDRISGRLETAARELDQAMSQLARLHVTREAGADVNIDGCGISLKTTGTAVTAGTVSAAVSSFKNAVGDISWYTGRLGTAVHGVYDLFETTENNLSGKKLDVGETAPVDGETESGGLSLDIFKEHLGWILLNPPGISFIPWGLRDSVYVFAGLDALGYEFSKKPSSVGVEAWIGKAHAGISGSMGSAEVNAYIGKAKAEAKAKGGIMQYVTKQEYKNGEWTEKETLKFLYGEAGVTASAALLAADAKGTLGDDLFGLEGKAEGTVGSAKLEGKANVSVGEDGVTAVAKGEAMVAAVEGKASGTINILGLEITGKVGGYAGAAGVKGTIGIEDNKFVLEGGVAAAIGASVGIEIGFNDEGWSNFASGIDDFVTFMENLW